MVPSEKRQKSDFFLRSAGHSRGCSARLRISAQRYATVIVAAAN